MRCRTEIPSCSLDIRFRLYHVVFLFYVIFRLFWCFIDLFLLFSKIVSYIFLFIFFSFFEASIRTIAKKYEKRRHIHRNGLSLMERVRQILCPEGLEHTTLCQANIVTETLWEKICLTVLFVFVSIFYFSFRGWAYVNLCKFVVCKGNHENWSKSTSQAPTRESSSRRAPTKSTFQRSTCWWCWWP